VKPRAGPRSANPITRPILPSGQWADIKIYNRNACLWSNGVWIKKFPGTGAVISVRKQYNAFLLIKFRFCPAGPILRVTKLQFPSHFWPEGYGFQRPAVANKLAMTFL